MTKRPVFFLLLLACLSLTDASKILGLFHFNGKSHFVMFEALMKELAARGHDVTVVSHYPQDPPLPNYRDISLKGSLPEVVGNVSVGDIQANWSNNLDMFMFIWTIFGVQFCDKMYQHPVIQQLIQTKEKYDLLITEQWGNDCFLPLAYKWGIPHMSVITTMEVPWGLRRYGSPINPSFQITHFTDFPITGLSFFERCYNTWFTIAAYIGHHIHSEIPTDRIVRKYLGDSLPPLLDIVHNSSLLLINAHFSVVGNRPLSRNVIEVGGLHIPDPKPLPQELQKYLDEADEGVILFALGSLIKAESFGQDKIQSFLQVFKSLPQRVLWKFGGVVENLPPNVKLIKWLPQSDVLRHKNVKLFITHGGLMGTQEAIYHGVPMVGIPFFSDQMFNIRNYVRMGIALELQFSEITKPNVEDRVKRILNNSSFHAMSKHYSRLFRDRPRTAREEAAYWTEYVIRHNGAPHLKSAGSQLHWFQYYLLDVFLAYAVSLFLVCKVAGLLLRKAICLIRKVCSRQSKKKIKGH